MADEKVLLPCGHDVNCERKESEKGAEGSRVEKRTYKVGEFRN
jgi:hypothetical protein